MKNRNESAIYRIGFMLEQTLGHVTHSQNLQANVPSDLSVNAYWGLLGAETTGLARHVPLYKSNWTVRAGFKARKIITALDRRVGLHALFFHTQVPAVLSIRWMQRIPSMVSLDATPLQYDRLGQFYDHAIAPAWLERWKWRRHRSCFRQAKHIVTWSQWTKQSLIDEYEIPAGKITVIPPGVDIDEWQCHSRGHHPQVIKILFVGADLKRKGGLLLLEAFRRLRHSSLQRRDKAELELHLVTRTEVAPEAGVLVYNDMQPNSRRLRDLYFDSDLFCLPSYGDCFPMALLEAAAAGLPVVSSRLAAIPEIIQEGETGFLIPVGDSQALESTLQRLVSNSHLRVQMGARTVAVARQRCDAGRNTSALLGLLKNIVDEAHGQEA
jgi:glycosyltransferase involved in cell wall biosynthesis